jgi:hypothetical protein
LNAAYLVYKVEILLERFRQFTVVLDDLSVRAALETIGIRNHAMGFGLD